MDELQKSRQTIEEIDKEMACLFEKRMDGPAEYDLATTDTLAYTSGTLSDPRKDFVDDRHLSDVPHAGEDNMNNTRR